MTRPMTKSQFPRALISSTVGTTLFSIAAVWLVTPTPSRPWSQRPTPQTSKARNRISRHLVISIDCRRSLPAPTGPRNQFPSRLSSRSSASAAGLLFALRASTRTRSREARDDAAEWEMSQLKLQTRRTVFIAA